MGLEIWAVPSDQDLHTRCQFDAATKSWASNQAASQPAMPNARRTSARVTRQGTFFSGKTGAFPRRLIRTLVISSATVCASSWAQAFEVNHCPSLECECARLATCSCLAGASFQATASDGFTASTTVRRLGIDTHHARQASEPSAPCDNLNFNLQRTSIPISPPYSKTPRYPPAGMDGSQTHGIPGAPQIETETSRSTEGPTQYQWQHLKEEIRELYRDKPLKDVRIILEQRHGFRATYVCPGFPASTDISTNLPTELIGTILMARLQRPHV